MCIVMFTPLSKCTWEAGTVGSPSVRAAAITHLDFFGMHIQEVGAVNDVV